MNNEDKTAGLFMGAIALTLSIMAIVISIIAVSNVVSPDTTVHLHTDDGTGGFVPK